MATEHIDLLMDDHGLIEKGMMLLENEMKKGKDINVKKFITLIDFFADFGDVCHNSKEEKVYFPLLLERGLPPQGPVAVMLEEHKQERQILMDLKGAAEKLAEDISGVSALESEVKDFLDMRKNHIWKENDILYPMGRNILTAADDTELGAQFKKIEAETIGEGGFQRFKNLLETLEKQSGGKVNLLNSLDLNVIVNMLDSIPVELSYVDADDTVRYFNHIEKKKIFPRTLSVIGRKVQQCHPQKSVHLVEQIISEMKSGDRHKASFWIQMGELFVHISYFAVRDEKGTYQGCVEMVHDVAPYRALEGDKRLLDEE